MADVDNLKRLDLADLHQPSQIANRIHGAIGWVEDFVPVERIAQALELSKVILNQFDGFEGMLLTDRRRSDGVILANTTRGDRRARFTIAHELGHFLMERHVPSDDAGFRCTLGDMKERSANTLHLRQESQANHFAVELLAPRYAYDMYLSAAPDLDVVRTLSNALNVSKEATARRYRHLHEGLIAMVFHKNGAVRYIDRSDEFPALFIAKHSALPASVGAGFTPGTLTDIEIADPKDWFDGPPMAELAVQTLYQNNGFGITMLTLNVDDPDEGGPEDTYDRHSRFG